MPLPLIPLTTSFDVHRLLGPDFLGSNSVTGVMQTQVFILYHGLLMIKLLSCVHVVPEISPHKFSFVVGELNLYPVLGNMVADKFCLASWPKTSGSNRLLWKRCYSYDYDLASVLLSRILPYNGWAQILGNLSSRMYTYTSIVDFLRVATPCFYHRIFVLRFGKKDYRSW